MPIKQSQSLIRYPWSWMRKHMQNFMLMSYVHIIIYQLCLKIEIWFLLLYICHTVIHRKLKNVVYMKKIDVKKKEGMGNQKHHRVLSTSTCVKYLFCQVMYKFYTFNLSQVLIVNLIEISNTYNK
jgi:hypothetical protein